MRPHSRLVREFFEAINTGDLESAGSLIDPSCGFVAPHLTATGPDAALAWMRPFLDALPGRHHQVLGRVEDDDAVASELDIAGTHTAPLVGPNGEIPPTASA